MLRRVDHIQLMVERAGEVAALFSKLGFEEVSRSEDRGLAIDMRLPGENQVLVELRTASGHLNPGLNHIAFLVDDCEASVAELEGKGVSFDAPASRMPNTGRTVGNFRDAVGFRLQLTSKQTDSATS